MATSLIWCTSTTDIDRHHIHIVGLRVDENGRPLNDKFEHRRSKQITRELEQKYNLHPAEKKARTERPELKKVDYTAGDVKHQIGNTVKAACYGYRFQSFGEYKALLATYNICAEEVKGEVNGKPYQGIVYSATNDKGEKVGNPVKASRIGKSVGYEAVQRRMEKSGEAIKNGKLKERTRKIVADAVRNTRSRKELEQQLKKQGIDVVFRQNDSGRIYGVTFIDHDSRVVLNGSRLGKEYSANVFNERFSGETGIYTSQKWKYGSGNNPRIRNSRTSRRKPTSFRVWLPCWVLSAVCWAVVHPVVTSRRTPLTKRERRRKRSAQGASNNQKTYTIMQQEDDLRGLARVMDFMRAVSILFVGINVYWFCYSTLKEWGVTFEVIDKILWKFQRTTGLFSSILWTKLFSVMFLALSCIGTKGVKEEKITWTKIHCSLTVGMVLFFLNWWLLELPLPHTAGTVFYITTLSAGYICMLMAGTWMSRLLKNNLMDDVFNMENESFQQETRLIENEYSVNLPTRFYYNKKWNNGWMNVVNPFRASLVLGTPGSGKSYAVVNNYIKQQIEKGFALYLYDYKFPDLSEIAYNHLLNHLDDYKVKPKFYVINFDDPRKSHRCNPINANFMSDIADAYEASYTIMLNLIALG